MGFLDSLADIATFGHGNMIHSFLHPEEAYEAAQRPLERSYEQARRDQELGYGRAQQYELPFLQQGQNEYYRLQQAINQLMNPESLYNQYAAGYETSPFAKRMLEMNQGAGLDAASQMGLIGSSAALSNIQRGAGDIVQSERQKYIQDLMDNYLRGIGLSSNIYNNGVNAGGILTNAAMGQGTNLANMGMDQGTNLANLAYNREAAPGQTLMNLLRTGASAYGASQGGGFGQYGANQGGGYLR